MLPYKEQLIYAWVGKTVLYWQLEKNYNNKKDIWQRFLQELLSCIWPLLRTFLSFWCLSIIGLCVVIPLFICVEVPLFNVWIFFTSWRRHGYFIMNVLIIVYRIVHVWYRQCCVVLVHLLENLLFLIWYSLPCP
jgi:hypothetical protein